MLHSQSLRFYVTTAYPNCTCTKYYVGDQIVAIEKGGPCGMYGEMRCVQDFDEET
jgi:hypothetical protein